MIEEHPRLGFAVLGAVLAALVFVVLLIGGGGSAVDGTGITYRAAPAPASTGAAPVTRSAGASRSARRTSYAVNPAWASRVGAAVGIPAPAMAAYGSVELRLHAEQPRCHLAWNTLAGIGWVESQHGTIGGRTLQADGRSSTPVIGPALNGQGFAAIRSTPASAAWHGDNTWEHAVGPLQFIPSTWARWAADGDGDGVEDPLDLDDAALAAGRYLCADGHDLATVSGWNAAIHSYNHDASYVLSVLDAANTYAGRVRS
ncbi:MAG: lytic murein transglycosylase [Marmoricola sp.]